MCDHTATAYMLNPADPDGPTLVKCLDCGLSAPVTEGYSRAMAERHCGTEYARCPKVEAP